jgi:putative ABC transport system permease protein
MFIIKVDKDYFKTLGIKFNEILPDFDNLNFKDDEYYVINKSAKDYIGWDVALEKEFSIFNNSFGQIAAVVNDFNFRSLHYETSPTAILVSGNPVADRMHIRIKQGYENEARLFINKKWKEFAPVGAPLLITDLQQDFQNLYTTEKKTRIIIILFTIIAMFISMLGLIGLASFIAAQRTKEIGIRKVLGASSQRVSNMLILGFVKWVFIAFVISVPLAYLYLNSWLNHFAYHINIGVGVFVITALFIFIIAVASVYIQTIRTASQNPINSLRYE